jgi:hypothetical protein
MSPNNEPPYRITLVKGSWHVRRPKAAMDHAFDDIDDAMTFVRNDSGATAEFVEVMAHSIYMVKRLDRAD